jgi:hypothetical protein
MSARPRLIIVTTAVVGFVIGLTVGAGAALAQSPSPSTVPMESMGPAAQPPSTGADTSGTTLVTSGGGESGAAGSAIAYPVYAGTPGVAPDHTIVVTGAGQAEMKGNGSNRAAAEKAALAAALADAKAQADAIAKATGLTLSGVLSVSASVSPYGVVMPMAPTEGSTPGVPAPDSIVASPQVLGVSVTVAYQVG